jgi:hypothetical protein
MCNSQDSDRFPLAPLSFKVSRVRLARGLAIFAFLALFPGYLVYHYAIARLWIPPVLGGLFGLSSAATFAVIAFFLFPWIFRSSTLGTLRLAVPIILLIAYLAIFSTVHLALMPDVIFVQEAFLETVGFLVTWVAVLFVGNFFPFDSPISRKALLWGGVVACVVIAHAIFIDGNLLAPHRLFSISDVGASTYQGIGRSLIVVTLLGTSLGRSMYVRMTILLIGLALLVTVGARAETIGLAFAFMSLVFVELLRIRSKKTLIFIFVVLPLALVPLVSIMGQSRLAEVMNLNLSASWESRSFLTHLAIHQIIENPLIGSFGGHFRDGGAGWYAHNALSAWSGYGFIAFGLYCVVQVFALTISADGFFGRKGCSRIWEVAFLLNIASTLLMLAVPIHSIFQPLGWGITMQAMYFRSRGWSGPRVPSRGLF